MKRVLSFMLLALGAIACEADKEPNVSGAESRFVPKSCVSPIVVSKALLGGNANTWETQNAALICHEDGSSFFVELSRTTSDPDNSKKALWLKNNDIYIDFSASRADILSSHAISSTSVSVVQSTSVTVAQIKSDLGTYYTNETYDYYYKIAFSPFSRSLVSSFQVGGGSFSIPLIKGIILPLNNTDTVDFIDANITTGGSTVRGVVIKVGSSYYDITENPK